MLELYHQSSLSNQQRKFSNFFYLTVVLNVTVLSTNKSKSLQECIPVRCVPSAVAISSATHAPPTTHTPLTCTHPWPCMPPLHHTCPPLPYTPPCHTCLPLPYMPPSPCTPPSPHIPLHHECPPLHHAHPLWTDRCL